MIRPIAIYLPQFHPIPENDEWWGKGFTEWTNVVKAKPRFKGHYQPHLPADLGFYDLRLPETRQQQADMAKKYGIYGFCYYHYWFNGKRLLERPFEEVFGSGKPDFPFCLAWANENWSRRWDGSDRHILIEQNYSEEDDRNHIRYLLKYFSDERYIKVDGKPVFAFYDPEIIPNIKRTLEIFREEAAKEHMELYLCRFERALGLAGPGINELGFDAAIDFQPLSWSLRKYSELYMQPTILKRIIRKLKKIIFPVLNKEYIAKDIIYDYGKIMEFDLQQELPNYKRFPGVSPMWDNSSRRTNLHAQIFKNSTPEIFGQWYKAKLENFAPYSKDENFIFLNAWNEWAEGNHLEPDQKYGTQYLEQLVKVHSALKL
jgi:lipopolysaccharide biosynthesis protein